MNTQLVIHYVIPLGKAGAAAFNHECPIVAGHTIIFIYFAAVRIDICSQRS